MKIFILKSIGENIFTNDSCIKKFIQDFSLNLNEVKMGCISGYFGEIDENNFIKSLPILNGLFGKYFFYEGFQNKIFCEHIFGKNIIDFEYDEKYITENSKKIENIKTELESGKLITNSKKEEFSKIILEGLYNIGGFLIKTYFLMDEMITNKVELKKIIDNPEGLDEFKAQANLLDKITFDKLDLIKTRFDMINLQLLDFSDILYKFFKNYIK